MKNKKSEKQICPKCGSTNIQTDFSNPAGVATGNFINTKKCNNCGHIGTFFPIIKKEKTKTINKRKKPSLLQILFQLQKK